MSIEVLSHPLTETLTETLTDMLPAVLAVLEGADGEGAQPSFFAGMMPLILIGVLAWVLLIGPERKRQKERQMMLAQLGKNDKVSTVGGLIGVITKVDDDQVTLRVADGVHLHVQRGSIAGLLAAPKKEDEKDS